MACSQVDGRSARIEFGTYSESSIIPTLAMMALALLESKFVALRLRRTSSIRGCIQPVRPGVLVGLFDPESVAGLLLGVRLIEDSFAVELESGEGADDRAAAVCIAVCEEGTIAVEDMVAVSTTCRGWSCACCGCQYVSMRFGVVVGASVHSTDGIER